MLASRPYGISCDDGQRHDFHHVLLVSHALQPGTYYLATCDSSTTPAVLVGQISAFSNVLAAAGVANSFGTDATDTCTAGVLPNTITVANITNSTTILAPIALMATN